MRAVHIGFPKTATTYLQRTIFPRLTDYVTYIDAETCAALFHPLINFDDTLFDAKDARDRVERMWGHKGKTLFSYEPLTGLEYRSGFVNRTPIAKRLKRLGFDRVIITIRNQLDALESAYKQYVKSGGVLSIDDYIGFDARKPKYLYPEYFDYSAIYRLYATVFGGANVLILQYEDLNAASFLGSLFSFLEIDRFDIQPCKPINTSLSREKTKILRVINHVTFNSYRPSNLISKRISTSLFHRCLSAMPMLNSSNSFFGPDERRFIASYYQESNLRLQSDAGLTLAQDYP